MSTDDPTGIDPCPENIPSPPALDTTPVPTHGNGKAKAPVEPPAPVREIVLQDNDKKALLHLNTIAQGIRAKYTDACIKVQGLTKDLHGAEDERDEHYKLLLTAQEKLSARLGEIAALQGIDLDAPDAGKWNFNFADMSFKRID
jgi:hypothetical protein